MGGVGVLRARGQERRELQGQGLCCFRIHLSLALHPLQRREACLGENGGQHHREEGAAIGKA